MHHLHVNNYNLALNTVVKMIQMASIIIMSTLTDVFKK